jgi:hypothetical protein
MALGFELGFMLARQVLYHLSHSTSPALVIFEAVSLYALLAGTTILLFMLPA